MTGLQIGKVVAVVDPEGAARIRVRMPLLGDPAAEIWARFAQPYASAGAGMMFLPEIDDEVVVAFLGGDPDAPVVLGALHSAARPQAEAPASDNALNTIRTLSALTIEFDDESKTVTIATPGGQSVALGDTEKGIALADENGNRITLGPAGITLESSSDITINARGIVAIAAEGDATIDAQNVTANAQMAATLKGSYSAELSAMGPTVVKGAIVEIN